MILSLPIVFIIIIIASFHRKKHQNGLRVINKKGFCIQNMWMHTKSHLIYAKGNCSQRSDGEYSCHRPLWLWTVHACRINNWAMCVIVIWCATWKSIVTTRLCHVRASFSLTINEWWKRCDATKEERALKKGTHLWAVQRCFRADKNLCWHRETTVPLWLMYLVVRCTHVGGGGGCACAHRPKIMRRVVRTSSGLVMSALIAPDTAPMPKLAMGGWEFCTSFGK